MTRRRGERQGESDLWNGNTPRYQQGTRGPRDWRVYPLPAAGECTLRHTRQGTADMFYWLIEMEGGGDYSSSSSSTTRRSTTAIRVSPAGPATTTTNLSGLAAPFWRSTSILVEPRALATPSTGCTRYTSLSEHFT